VDAELDRLTRAMRSNNLQERLRAAEQLAQAGAAARPAAILLVQTLADSNEELRQWVTAALEDMGPPLPGDVDALRSLVASPVAEVAYWAATLMGRLGEGAAAAVGTLAAALNEAKELAVRERAAWALGQIGPAAREARQALEQAAHSPSPRLARLGREALEKLGHVS
jgi:HEAT repeat protein